MAGFAKLSTDAIMTKAPISCCPVLLKSQEPSISSGDPRVLAPFYEDGRVLIQTLGPFAPNFAPPPSTDAVNRLMYRDGTLLGTTVVKTSSLPSSCGRRKRVIRRKKEKGLFPRVCSESSKART